MSGEVTARKPRPKYLALNEIRLPLPGIVSILHRISGVGLFLMLPFLLYLLDQQPRSPETFETFAAVVRQLVHQARPVRPAVGLPSLLRRHPFLHARPAQGSGARGGTSPPKSFLIIEPHAALIIGVVPMVKQRTVVGAHYGLKDWIAQRATAVHMAAYTIIFALCVQPARAQPPGVVRPVLAWFVCS